MKSVKQQFIEYADRKWGKSDGKFCQTERFASYYEVWKDAIKSNSFEEFRSYSITEESTE